MLDPLSIYYTSWVLAKFQGLQPRARMFASRAPRLRFHRATRGGKTEVCAVHAPLAAREPLTGPTHPHSINMYACNVQSILRIEKIIKYRDVHT